MGICYVAYQLTLQYLVIYRNGKSICTLEYPPISSVNIGYLSSEYHVGAFFLCSSKNDLTDKTPWSF